MIPMTRPHKAAGSGPVFFTTHGTLFYGTALGTNTGQITYKTRMRIAAYPSVSETYFCLPGIQFRTEIMPDGALRANLKDNANATLISNHLSAAGVVPLGAFFDLTVAVDLAAGTYKVWVNGALVLSPTFTSASPTFQTSRQVCFLTANSGGTGTPVTADIEYLKFWKDVASTDGSDPGTATLRTITGPATTANADGWKLGGDAT